LFTYNGEITLDPPQDTWTDTSVQPDVQINFDGNLDAWQNLADAWGTQWGDWQTNWTGVTDSSATTNGGNVSVQGDTLYQDVVQTQTTTTTQRQTRQGMTISVTPDTQVQRIGAKVTNTSIVPFMRSITISFVADRLKPDTVVYPFFDGEPVSDSCRPLDTAAIYDPANYPANQTHAVLSSQFVSGDYGAVLKTDSQGRVAGQFTIPANRFRVGSKPFRLCDDSKNRDTFITTAASENFVSSGLSQSVEGTVISTRSARVAATTISDSRSVQDSTSTEAIIGQRQVGVVQNTNITNDFTTVNNTTTIVENTIVQPPTIVDPPCFDCGVNWTPNLPIIQAPDGWGVDTPAPVEQTGPVPSQTGDETVQNGQVTTGSGGDGYNTGGIDQNSFNVVSGNWDWEAMDPTAQTFLISNMPFGTFITKVDLYFRTASTTLPITLQLREVVNGYPGNTIIPFGSVTLYPTDVNVSEDASVATPFTFPSPVYLQNNTEYCMVLLPAGNNPDYNVWVSELGADTIGVVPVQRISEQPFAGVLFVSANNNSWTALQAEDLKFTMYRADFDTSAAGAVFFKNAPIDYLNIALTNSGDTITAGDTVNSVLATTGASGTGTTATVTFAAQSVAPYAVGSTIRVAGVTPSGYNGDFVVTACTINSVTWASTTTGAQTVAGTVSGPQGYVFQYDVPSGVAKVYVTSGVFTDITNVTFGADEIPGTISAIEKKLVNTLSTNIGYVEYTPNSSTWSYRSFTSSGVSDGTFSAFSTAHTLDFGSERAVYSYSDEVHTLTLPSQEGSLMFRLDMYTLTSTVSPIIDLRKSSVILVANDINNVDTGETGIGGSARSKYITRQVVLDDGQDAEDITVYLTQNAASGASIEVYAKLLNGSDSSTFASRPWTLMDIANAPTGTQTANSFGEWKYTLPSTVMTGPSGQYKYTTSGSDYVGFKTFAVKIVMLSSNTSSVPRVKDLRVIALQM
jgi:hypothetical protein